MEDPILDQLKAQISLDLPGAEILFARQVELLSGDPIAQFQFSRSAAILGSRDATHRVIWCYQAGEGTEPDRVRAFEWLRKGDAADDKARFAFDLACCYRDGDGTAKDIEKFWRYMTKAAEAGENNTEAMFQLAEGYLNPELGEPSPDRAYEWTRRMADEGQPGALVQLARKHDDGKSVDRDPAKFLDYATRATEAARKQWKHRQKADWTYEDLPDALSTLADALTRNARPAEAAARLVEAADTAWESFCVAVENGRHVGQLLPEIMLRILPQLKTKSGSIAHRNRGKYLQCLINVRTAIGHIYLSRDAKEIPTDLVDAIFQLAVAYRDGIGTAPQEKEYQKYLREAADAGHGQAAFLSAMDCLRNDEILAFNQFISLAAHANDTDAMIVQQLFSIGLPLPVLEKASGALRALRETVVLIRTKDHRIDHEKAANGIAHYTNADALTNMLSASPLDGNNGVRLSSTVYVNDPTEGRRLKDFKVKGKKNPLTALFADVDEGAAIAWLDREFHVFIACFSLQCDTLNLWRFYGSDGKGYSVVSPPSSFDAGSTEGMIRSPWAKRGKVPSKLALYTVLYEDKQVERALARLENAIEPVQRIANELEPQLGKRVRSVAIAVISDLLYLYKDQQYSDEKEVRAAEARMLGDPDLKDYRPANKQYSKLYLETGALLFREPGSKIIIGPKVEDREAVMIDLQHRLARQNWSGTCKVIKSDTNYR